VYLQSSVLLLSMVAVEMTFFDAASTMSISLAEPRSNSIFFDPAVQSLKKVEP